MIPVSDHRSHEILDSILIELENQSKILLAQLSFLRQISSALQPPTPTLITFKEITMNPEGPGVTQVWTGTLTPSGSAFPAGVTFTATPSDPTVTVGLDPTGLIVTIIYPSTFVPGPTPFSVAWSTSTFTPEPSTSPSVLTATITPTVPTPTPTGVSFAQTT